MNALALHLAEAYPDLNRGRDITVFAHDEVRFHPDADGSVLTASLGLFTVAGLVLLLACGNLGNLLLVRGIARGPELAVRRALGAGRVRVMRLLLLEALLLSGVGAAAGLGLAAWSLRIVPSLPLPVPGGGLLTRSLVNVQRVDPGFDVGQIAVLGTNLQQGGVPDTEAAIVAARVLERVEALPGVQRAALTSRLPVQRAGTTTQVVDGYEPAAGTGSMALRDVRATLPVTRLTTLDAHLGGALAGARVIAGSMGALSLLALLLAGLGVYAVVSFSVERRGQELGIRSALGAAGSRLVGMVVAETLVMVALGVGVGLCLALLAARGLEGMLYGVGSFDAVTFGAAALLLLGAAGAAAFLPARRAAKVDPVEVLRNA